MKGNNKLLTIAIPCYNSESYLQRALKSTLIGDNRIEVLIVDDGSTDKTPEMADAYAAKYPDIIKVIHKENGGHGDAVMTGLANASGKYYKVLDSDDWLNRRALAAVMNFLAENDSMDNNFDMIISDYVYEKAGKKHKKRINYRNVMPVRTPFNWNKLGRFMPWQNILMHSVIYRTTLLRKSGIEMPKHTFYVDNIYVYHPLPFVRKIYYLDVDLYHYVIGRSDQSVNEKVMMSRIDQQVLVTKLMIEDHNLRNVENGMLRRYMSQYLAMMMTISTAFLIKIGTPESLAERDKLWSFLKEHSSQYKYVYRHFLGKAMQMKSKPGMFIIKTGYTISQKLVGFN
ncbi:MAG: glycosyltransferase family 2 protein [Eubacterium sp.]|jgi:glycosyltransferase involved in cell wall biosynthesis|nr:glycosyltransferase family 2 protein [Eubacterium sp.]MBR6217186.1 glycosyltransferase family 2 protein [Eubacterium sp.]HBE09614.1 glycosyl transferase [Lachnospiraceae bacterium]